MLNSNYKIENLLNDDEIRVYRELICETLSYIDDKHIVDFDLIGICFFYNVGLPIVSDETTLYRELEAILVNQGMPTELCQSNGKHLSFSGREKLRTNL